MPEPAATPAGSPRAAAIASHATCSPRHRSRGHGLESADNFSSSPDFELSSASPASPRSAPLASPEQHLHGYSCGRPSPTHATMVPPGGAPSAYELPLPRAAPPGLHPVLSDSEGGLTPRNGYTYRSPTASLAEKPPWHQPARGSVSVVPGPPTHL